MATIHSAPAPANGGLTPKPHEKFLVVNQLRKTGPSQLSASPFVRKPALEGASANPAVSDEFFFLLRLNYRFALLLFSDGIDNLN